MFIVNYNSDLTKNMEVGPIKYQGNELFECLEDAQNAMLHLGLRELINNRGCKLENCHKKDVNKIVELIKLTPSGSNIDDIIPNFLSEVRDYRLTSTDFYTSDNFNFEIFEVN